MKQERIMSFQMAKPLDEVSVEKVSGGSNANFNLPQPTFHYSSDGGFSVSLDNPF